MLRWFALVALLALPGAEACADQTGASAALDLTFPKPEGCKRDAPEACPALPEADFPLVIEGILLWSWELDAACSTTIPSTMPVHIHLQGLERTAAGWLEVTSDPSEITIEPQQQWDLTDDSIDPATARMRGQESFPLRVTIALVGEPSAEALDRLDARNGIVQVDLRALAEATDTFVGVSGLEAFLLDGRPAMEPADGDGGRDIPSPSALLALAVLGLAVAAARRR